MSLLEGIVSVSRSEAPVVESGRDRAGYAAVFAAHQDAVIGLAYVMTGDRFLAEEVAAEAFARVWPHWQAGRVADDRNYLRRAVVNEVRSRWRRRLLERREEERQRHDPARVADVDRAGEHDAVVRAMARLRPSERAVVALRFLEDLSEADTAEALGMRIGTVKSQTSRALARLRVLLEEEER